MTQATVACKTPTGRTLATVTIYALGSDDSALIERTEADADAYGEARVQLRERGRYEYRIDTPGFALQESRGVTQSKVAGGGIGRIEPQDFCGQLSLILTETGKSEPLAQGVVEVRSYKLGYRDDYRGMLTDIAERCVGLLQDCRAPTQLKLETLWKEDGVPEQQLEFLRFLIESPMFQGAIDQVLRNPHRLLEEERELREIGRPFKPGKDFARQVAMASQRVGVPAGHPLRPLVASLPARVSVATRRDFLDTPENRFVKSVLLEFRDFLTTLAAHLNKSKTTDNTRLLRETDRLRGKLETQLTRGFFPDLSTPATLPLGSPVLQRKAGYRELLHFWLQFHTSSQLAWDGAQDVFQAGARNVATLYEYWLFFQLEALFREKFTVADPLHSIALDKNASPPRFLLKRGQELRAVGGVAHPATGRELSARFQFNRKFARNSDHTKPGSWTRHVQPDYTISIWPTEYSEQEAEANELLVHIHFDAKYRVEKLADALGPDNDDSDAFIEAPENPTAAKYTDLLKMHAYRDAIRRTAGAYVLYPGNPTDGNKEFQGFHEVLPGLGAFAVAPDKDGKPKGIAALSQFLDKVIEHLAHRTTARERTTYHHREAYRAKEKPEAYRAVPLPESDTIYGKDFRALPPNEELVLVAWYNSVAQLALAQHEEGFLYVRLGDRPGALHIHPNFAQVRRAILRTNNEVVASGAFLLREAGYFVYNRDQLRATLNKYAQGKQVAKWQDAPEPDDANHIYALYKVKPDPEFAQIHWDGEKIMDLIEAFESDRRNRLVKNVGRRSPDPRLLPLGKLLQAQK